LIWFFFIRIPIHDSFFFKMCNVLNQADWDLVSHNDVELHLINYGNLQLVSWFLDCCKSADVRKWGCLSPSCLADCLLRRKCVFWWWVLMLLVRQPFSTSSSSVRLSPPFLLLVSLTLLWEDANYLDFKFIIPYIFSVGLDLMMMFDQDSMWRLWSIRTLALLFGMSGVRTRYVCLIEYAFGLFYFCMRSLYFGV